LIAYCKERLKKFLDCKQLTIVEGAVVNSDLIDAGSHTIRFYKNCCASIWGTVNADWAERNARLGAASSVIDVRAISFSDAIVKYGMPYYMKIDIEGWDTVCIESLRDFEERPTYISMESDKMRFENIEREIDLLAELGYISFQAIEQSAIPWSQSPPYPPKEGRYVAQRFERGSSGLFGAELQGNWKSKREILRQYFAIRLGYCLLGDNGIMNKWKFAGSSLIRFWTRATIRQITRASVPGWYDTHARHRDLAT
jgi:hypothetical protein